MGAGPRRMAGGEDPAYHARVPGLPEAGDRVAGYRIERPLGRGGMGVVFLAEQIRLRRKVALKLILPELAEDDEFKRRFERESQLAASLDHPNIITVHEAGEIDGALFISMRYVEGRNLKQLIAQEIRLDPRRTTELVSQLGSALDAAHSHGLVHRDVKPANVLVSGGGPSEHAYLTDFGLTKHVSSASDITRTGQWVGTLDFVAPEQISGGPLDARVDVYALGCVLFQMLTGRVPFPRDSDVAKMYAHLHELPERVSELVPGLPPEFDTVVERALAKQPGARYPSAGDLARAALAAGQGSHPTAPERSVAAGAAAGGGDGGGTNVTTRLDREAGPWPPDAPSPPAGGPSRPKWPVLVVCATALAIAGMATALAATGAFSGSSTARSQVAASGGQHSATSPSTASTPTAPRGGDWPRSTDGYTVVLASTTSRSEAERRVADARAAGLSPGILNSSDHSSLHPGYWVAFDGVFGSLADARREQAIARRAGFTDAYTRHVSPG
jgi:serine/threonine protein kinase